MASNRWVAIDPDILTHPLVGAGQQVPPADPSRGSYSRMEAWIWLICNASFADHTVINRGRKMTLARGDLLGAWAFLAHQWNWSAKTVRTWVEKLIADNMLKKKAVELQSEHHGSSDTSGTEDGKYYGNQAQVLSVVNYWRFQFERYEERQPERQPERQANGNQRATEGQHITKEQGNKGTEENKKEKGTDAPSPSLDLEALQVFNEYNEVALKVGLAQARSLDPDRKKAIKARLREHGGLEAWAIVKSNIERSAFLQGRNDRNWRPNGFDWFLKHANFRKVLEGAFGNGAHADDSGPGPKKSPEERMREYVEAEQRKEGKPTWTR